MTTLRDVSMKESDGKSGWAPPANTKNFCRRKTPLL
jgi:hypothetical protein